MIRVDVRTDIDRAVLEFSPTRTDVAQATYRALNRALDKMATETSREVRKAYAVRDRAVKQAMRKQRANRNRLYARLILEGMRIPLEEFSPRAVNPWNVPRRSHRKRGGGVSVRIKVRDGRKVIEGAFLARGRVYRRLGVARMPIRRLRSIAVPQAVANRAVREAIESHAREAFAKNFRQQLVFLRGGN